MSAIRQTLIYRGTSASPHGMAGTGEMEMPIPDNTLPMMDDDGPKPPATVQALIDPCGCHPRLESVEMKAHKPVRHTGH